MEYQVKLTSLSLMSNQLGFKSLFEEQKLNLQFSVKNDGRLLTDVNKIFALQHEGRNCSSKLIVDTYFLIYKIYFYDDNTIYE